MFLFCNIGGYCKVCYKGIFIVYKGIFYKRYRFVLCKSKYMYL